MHWDIIILARAVNLFDDLYFLRSSFVTVYARTGGMIRQPSTISSALKRAKVHPIPDLSMKAQSSIFWSCFIILAKFISVRQTTACFIKQNSVTRLKLRCEWTIGKELTTYYHVHLLTAKTRYLLNNVSKFFILYI